MCLFESFVGVGVCYLVLFFGWLFLGVVEYVSVIFEGISDVFVFEFFLIGFWWYCLLLLGNGFG